MSVDNLRRFIFSLPRESSFEFTDEVRTRVRKALFLAISDEGKYLDWFFPSASSDSQDKLGQNELIERVGQEFEWLFSNYYSSELRARDPKFNTHNHHAYHSNLPCARIFRKGEPIIRCLTCGYDDTCALCSHCYQPEHHVGHNLHITICQRENGGVCDCGDPEAWVKEFICDYGIQEEKSSELRSRPLPDGLGESFFKTIEVLLDFVIDIISHSNLQFYNSDASDISKVELSNIMSMLCPTKYGYDDDLVVDENNDQYYLIVYNDQIRHYRDAVQRIHLASKKVTQFAVMVTDEVQNHGKAKVISSRNIPLLQERQKILGATGLATCIRSHRDAFREDMCHEVLVWLNDLTESEMFKINNHAKDLFCRAFCCKWSKGLAHYSRSDLDYQYEVGTLDASLKIPKVPSNNTKKSQSHWYFKPCKWNLEPKVCEECNYNLTDEDYDLRKSHWGSRFQYFVYLDIRFWKSIRTLLHDMFATSLITNLSYKHIISCQYVDIYPTIADMFLTLDREPELNIMCTLSTQLFTCPSNATYIVQHGDISRIFASIYCFLTAEEIKAPENVDISQELSMKSLRNRRWGQIFFDIGYILSRSHDSKSIFTSNIIPMACDILALFQGRPIIKRESKNHVEYESPDYTAFFHAILVIYQFGEYIAHCIYNLQDIEIDEKRALTTNAINYVSQFLLTLENNDYPGLIEEFVDINIGNDKQISKELIDGNIIQNFRIDSEKVSFLHPIHSFLSWLIEMSKFSSPAELKSVLETSVTSSSLGSYQSLDIPNPLASIFDYPIRTIVLISQIKSGFWVRNGFSVRSQLQLYRTTGLRESGYLRDLFLTQVFINASNPNLFCFLLFSRWLFMDGWLLGSEEGNTIYESDETYGPVKKLVYDGKTLPYMLEECLNFFIHLLTEDLYLQGLKEEEVTKTRLRNEIIHNLCFGPMSFTQLCGQIPDHITSDKRFDILLDDMTQFKVPTGAKDIGVYKLKEEYYNAINPYYVNYSTNTKDDAIKFVKQRLLKKFNKPKSEIVIEPKLKDPEVLGPYRHIGNFSASSYFSNYLIRTLNYIIDEGIKELDSLLETTLHLIHICSYEQYIDIEKYGTFYDRFVNILDTYGTSIAILLYRILSNEQFAGHHSKIRAIFRLFENKYGGLGKILNDQVNNFDPVKLELRLSLINDEEEYDRKKRIAKLRQEKLMAKFKMQQTLFLESNSFESSECSDAEMEDPDGQEGWRFPQPHCLLCQNAAENAGPFGIITYIAKSSEFRTTPFEDPYWFLKAFSDSPDLSDDEYNVAYQTYTDNWEIYMSKVRRDNDMGPGFTLQENVESKLVSLSCGHGMHFQCYMNFLNGNRNRLNQITRNTPENIDHKEFLCPLCKAINNMFVPVLWSSNKRSLANFLHPCNEPPLTQFERLNRENVYDEEWFGHFSRTVCKDVEESLNMAPGVIDMISEAASDDSTLNQLNYRLILTNMFQILTLLTFPKILRADSSLILTNTIKSAEISLRGVPASGLLLISQLSNIALTNLRTLHEFRNTNLFMKIKNWIQTPNSNWNTCLKFLSNLLLVSSDSINEAIIERDFFDILVDLFPLPSLGFLFNSILQLCFTGQLIQTVLILVTEILKNDYYRQMGYSIYDVPIISDVQESDAASALSVFNTLKSHITNSDSAAVTDIRIGYVFYSMIIKAMTPFLRRSCILAFVACADTGSIDFEKYEDIQIEANRLTTFLNISSISHLLNAFSKETDHSFETMKFRLFVEYLLVKKLNERIEIKQSLDYPGIIKLINLPERLDFFFSKYYYLDKFNNPHTKIEDPAVCLFCGTVVDIQKREIGCKEGQCTTHFLKECANSIGLFLLPKERTFLLLHENGGSFYNSPYLDKHGELSVESKKNQTLHLMRPRYDDFIRNVWLNHNVQNYIVRKLDGVMDAGGWETL
ncbi:uncharacterized protein PRCAT00000563001 [Priceomyces carsonii]|uniref:uncharacterized protein n=1 Tax=Priceomyces carsonii TaxID=28549 RepID=UPI002EDA64C8|nr:unnamed protein product [Priceomyces carsonii]